MYLDASVPSRHGGLLPWQNFHHWKDGDLCSLHNMIHSPIQHTLWRQVGNSQLLENTRSYLGW